MSNNNFFNGKRFAQLLKINWMLSSKLYVRVCLALLVGFIVILWAYSQIYTIPTDNDEILIVTYKNIIYVIAMLTCCMIVGANSFRALDSNTQINQHLLPVSVFERYLIAVLEFITVLIVGTLCYLIAAELVQRIIKLKYTDIVLKTDISIIQYIQFIFTHKLNVLNLLLFTAAFFFSTTIRLWFKKSNPIKTILIIAGIILVSLLLLAGVYLLVLRVWNKDMALTMTFNNFNLFDTLIFTIIVFVLFLSTFLSYYLLKRRPHA